MKAKTITGNSPAEIQIALRKSRSDGFEPTLAIITLTNIENAKSIQSIFDRNAMAIFGFTTSQKFTDEGLESDDIVAMLLDMKPEHFRIVLNNYGELSAYEAGFKAGTTGKNIFTNPGFIITPIDSKISGDELIRGLTDAAGKEASIMGGAAGNPADFSGVLFTNSSSTNAGILSLIIDLDEVVIDGLAVSGWKPVGTTKKITKSEGSWIYTIDERPAMDVIERFLGNDTVTPDEQARGVLPSELGYPLQFQRASGNAIMRPVLFWNTSNRSIMIAGEVKEGELFRFSLPPDFDSIETVVESTGIFKEKYIPEIDAMLIFSCVGRLGTFGPMITAEIEGLASRWNKPMLGFFSLGEFGKLDGGQSEFHGTTVSWIALKEK